MGLEGDLFELLPGDDPTEDVEELHGVHLLLLREGDLSLAVALLPHFLDALPLGLLLSFFQGGPLYRLLFGRLDVADEGVGLAVPVENGGLEVAHPWRSWSLVSLSEFLGQSGMIPAYQALVDRGKTARLDSRGAHLVRPV